MRSKLFFHLQSSQPAAVTLEHMVGAKSKFCSTSVQNMIWPNQFSSVHFHLYGTKLQHVSSQDTLHEQCHDIAAFYTQLLLNTNS